MMMFQTFLLLISLLLAALLGFAAHRASICTVKAVEEVLTTRRAFMLLSFGKTILWIMGFTTLLFWALPEVRVNLTVWQMSLYGLAGGLIFGVGAVFNNGCAFSTLTRLGDGELSMLLSLGGFILGIVIFGLLTERDMVQAATHGDALLAWAAHWPLLILAAFLLWGFWEAWRLWRTRPAGRGLLASILSERYRLSTAALVMGISNALLYALNGKWAYTSTLNSDVQQIMNAKGQPDLIPWLLFLFLIAGMVFSACLRRSFRLRWRPTLGWVRNLVGGILMGFGAALVPGGNDVLILHGIPMLSPHAIPAYAAMLTGIALALGVMRLAGATFEKIDCSGDICTR